MSGAPVTLPSTPAGESPFSVGEVIAGKYSIERIVGVGGMAIVFAAHHLELDQPVAIKALLPQHATDVDLQRRFLTEARAAAKLKSVHVARISDVATVDTSAGRPLPIIVMELLDGRDLGAVLEDRGRLTTAQALNFVLQACDAVAEAHALGIVHRDLKPSNLFLVERNGSPIVKLLDFGISKHTSATGASSGARAIFGRGLAKDTALAGTPAYMSPEQIEGKQVDARTDIWALGVILHELLTGRDPFAAEDLNATLDKVLKAPAPKITDAAPEVPPDVVAIVERCLQKDRDRRYASTGELIAALSEALGEISMVSMVSGIARVGNVPSSHRAPEKATRVARSPAQKIGLGLIVTFAVVGLMLLAAFVAVRTRTPDAPPPVAVAAPESAFPPPPPLPASESTPPAPVETAEPPAPMPIPTTTITTTGAAKPTTRATTKQPTKKPSTPNQAASSHHRTDW